MSLRSACFTDEAFVCVCVCARTRARGRACVCVRARARESERERERDRKSETSVLGSTPLKRQFIRISELLEVRLKEFC
jgi:hypothetical protein